MKISKKIISFIIIFYFSILIIPSNGFSAESNYSKQLNYQSTLQKVLLQAHENKSPDDLLYAMHSIKFIMESQKDKVTLIELASPFIQALNKSQLVAEKVFPTMLKTTNNFLNSETDLENIKLLQELQIALNEAIQSNYKPEKVTYAVEELNKVITQSNFSIDQLMRFIDPIIDVFIEIIRSLSGMAGTVLGGIGGLTNIALQSIGNVAGSLSETLSNAIEITTNSLQNLIENFINLILNMFEVIRN